MKKDNLIWWIIGGIGAFALYRYYQKKNSVKNNSTNVLGEILVQEEAKYDSPLLAQYNIVLPADMVSKKVKAKGKELTEGRFAPQPQNIQAPLFI